MNHFSPAAITVPTDDDLPRYPDPADDALASPMARRYFRAVADGQRDYSGNSKPSRLPVTVHGL
jgi:hypothetical protein